MGLRPKMETYVIIPEDIVRSASDSIPDDPLNNFRKVLNAGQMYKDAGLTPIYLLDQTIMDLYVIAKELQGKKLH
jgi:hypothetical protein